MHFVSKMGQLLSCLKLAESEISKSEPSTLSESDTSSVTSQHLYGNNHPMARRSKGHYYHLVDGRKVLDACGGAGVSCLGHGNTEILKAMYIQSKSLTYVPWAFLDNPPTLELQEWLARSTDGKLPKVYLTSSG